VSRGTASRTHLVVIPSYNTGAKVYETVRDARARWAPVWVVVDGSTDGTAEGLQGMAADDPDLRVTVLPRRCLRACRRRGPRASRMRWRWIRTASTPPT
jgi:glycosyltransferase involved in cell wall biosynthesis